MPSVSGKQHRFMEMVAHDPAAAKRVGVPQSVGEDFSKADKGKTFSDHMKAHGYAKGPHKRHPATSHTSAFGREGNKFRSRS